MTLRLRPWFLAFYARPRKGLRDELIRAIRLTEKHTTTYQTKNKEGGTL